MRSYSSIRLLFSLALLILAGCTPMAETIHTAAPTDDFAVTQAYERNLVATVLAHRRTEEALQETVAAQQETLEAREILAKTATVETRRQMETLEAQATQAAAIQATQQAKTATQIVQKTEQVKPIYEIVKRLHDEQVIATTEGTYHRLEDFDQSWAQMHWYQWWRTGLKLENFVVRVDAEWESASKTADWYAAGCGFVYAEKGTDNHFASFLALDGNVYNARIRHGISSRHPSGYFGRLDTPAGSAELMLVVDQTVVSFYVNGERVSRFSDSTLGKGDFALTLNSGTNLDYGTRCRMTNIDVWELK
jgi:hypothetical protein